MSIVFQLSQEDRDQLKELLNIGVSYAGTTLSQMVGHRISISVPNVDIKSAETTLDFIDKPDEITLAVLLRLSEGFDGYVFLYFPHDATAHLLNSLSGKKITDLRVLDQYDRSIFQEVGNVLTGGMLQGLSKFLHVKLVQSVPEVVIDMGGAMFNSLAATLIATHDEFLSLEVVMCIDSSPDTMVCDGEQLSGKVFLFFGPDTTKRILEITRPMVAPGI